MSGHQRTLTMRFLAEPTDVNYGGKGARRPGDEVDRPAMPRRWAGAVAASVTVAVGGIRFVAPIRISDLVTVKTTLVHTGTTSMHFAVDVHARDPMDEHMATACTVMHCVIVFVALDGVEGSPVPVPMTPTTDEDRWLAEYALQVMA